MSNSKDTKELMLKIIEAKKEKSASQSGLKRSPTNLGHYQGGKKKKKKGGGLFDK